jgi:hypothetical protein
MDLRDTISSAMRLICVSMLFAGRRRASGALFLFVPVKGPRRELPGHANQTRRSSSHQEEVLLAWVF